MRPAPLPARVAKRLRRLRRGRCRWRIHYTGQINTHGRTDVYFAVDGDVTTRLLDDAETSRQTQAGALPAWFRRKECVEYLVGFVQGQPGPCVMNRNVDLAVLTQLRLHRKHAARILHRLDTIEHEVHQYLLQLHPVRRDFGKIGGKVRTNRNGMLVGFAPQQRDHFAYDLIYRDELSFGRGLFVQRSQTVDNLRGKGARLDDTFRSFAHLRQIGRVALKPSQRCLGING